MTVQYGTTTSYGSTATTFGNGWATLTPLNSKQTYYYKITSKKFINFNSFIYKKFMPVRLKSNHNLSFFASLARKQRALPESRKPCKTCTNF